MQFRNIYARRSAGKFAKKGKDGTTPEVKALHETWDGELSADSVRLAVGGIFLHVTCALVPFVRSARFPKQDRRDVP